MLAPGRPPQRGSKPRGGDVGHVEKRQRVRSENDLSNAGNGQLRMKLTGARRNRHNGVPRARESPRKTQWTAWQQVSPHSLEWTPRLFLLCHAHQIFMDPDSLL